MPYNTRSKRHNEEIKAGDNNHRPTKKEKTSKSKQVQIVDNQPIKKEKMPDKKNETKTNDENNHHQLKRGRKSKAEKEKETKNHDSDVDFDMIKKEEVKPAIRTVEKIPRSAINEGVNLENGHIYFFYRPKLNVNEKESNQSINDIQRLFMLLIPQNVRPTNDHPDEKRTPSLIIIGSKKLPLINSHERYWGFVSDASDDFQQLLKDFKEHSYETKTRSKRFVKAVRILGIGAYAISRHQDKRNSYLSYILTDPDPLSSVQEEFNLENQGTFAFSIKNPKVPYQPSAGENIFDAYNTNQSSSSSRTYFNKDPNFPDWLQKQLGDLSFLSITDTTLFLNYPNCQVLLVGARNSIDVDEIGASAVEALNLITGAIKQKSTANVIEQDLKINLSDYSIEPLKGRWA